MDLQEPAGSSIDGTGPHLDDEEASQAKVQAPLLRKKTWAGRMLMVTGLVGLALASYMTPEHGDLIAPTAAWSAATLASMIILFAGIPGAYHGYIRPIHLKVIDLVWVLASGVAVLIAVVQTSQVLPEMTRTNIARTLEKARSNGHALAKLAYEEQCSPPTALSDEQCEDLRFIANMLIDEAWLPRAKVVALCPIPLDPGSPPSGYGRHLVGACLNALNIVSLIQDPVMIDKDNVERWRFAFLSWPYLMMILVALRIMKSVSEVFWVKSA